MTDETLCAIYVDPSWTVDKSIAKTNEARVRRIDEIEDAGNYTESTVLGIGNNRAMKTVNESPRSQGYDPNTSYLSGMNSRSCLEGEGEEEGDREPAVRLPPTLED